MFVNVKTSLFILYLVLLVVHCMTLNKPRNKNITI